MARQLRIEYEGAFYHITSRGNQREKIFWDDKDREEFKKILKMYLSKRLSGKKDVEIGRKFGVSIQAVSNAIRDIERKSDRDRKLDDEINLIKRSVEEENV